MFAMFWNQTTTPTPTKTPSKATSTNSDAAKDAGRILDIISESRNIASVLDEFKNKRADILPKRAVQDLEIEKRNFQI